MRPKTQQDNGSKAISRPEKLSGLTPEELENESAVALPERAVMSTLSMLAVDPASATAASATATASHVTPGASGSPADASHAAPVATPVADPAHTGPPTTPGAD